MSIKNLILNINKIQDILKNYLKYLKIDKLISYKS